MRNKVKAKKEHLFKKGQSGNPKGRPPGFSQLLKAKGWDIFNEMAELYAFTPEEDYETELAKKKLSKFQIRYLALMESFDETIRQKAIESFADRLWGRAASSGSVIEDLEKIFSMLSNTDLMKKLSEKGFTPKGEK